MERNPYKIEGPAIISVSGGRTSGFMLRQIIDAHGGKLPADVIPVFCNTGLEHEATYRFLKTIAEQWTPIVWLEYRHNNGHDFAIVDFCSASRNGEPFTQIIDARTASRGEGILPNPRMRYCSGELKIRTGNRYAKSLGWTEWSRAVGLRYDEPRRFHKLVGEGGEARHTIADVIKFWEQQPFDLELPGDDHAFGNCVGCFLKSVPKMAKLMRSVPEHFDWWIEQERRTNTTFRIDRPTYRQMVTQLTVQGQMFDDAIEDDTLPCACTD